MPGKLSCVFCVSYRNRGPSRLAAMALEVGLESTSLRTLDCGQIVSIVTVQYACRSEFSPCSCLRSDCGQGPLRVVSQQVCNIASVGGFGYSELTGRRFAAAVTLRGVRLSCNPRNVPGSSKRIDSMSRKMTPEKARLVATLTALRKALLCGLERGFPAIRFIAGKGRWKPRITLLRSRSNGR